MSHKWAKERSYDLSELCNQVVSVWSVCLYHHYLPLVIKCFAIIVFFIVVVDNDVYMCVPFIWSVSWPIETVISNVSGVRKSNNKHNKQKVKQYRYSCTIKKNMTTTTTTTDYETRWCDCKMETEKNWNAQNAFKFITN